jgi:hypothetical protein
MRIKLKKYIQELDANIGVYITKEKLMHTEKNKRILFELCGWRNFLIFATGLTENERCIEFEKHRDILIYHF